MRVGHRSLVLVPLVGILVAGCSSDEDPTGDGGGEEAELTALIRAEYGSDLIPLPDTPPYPPDNNPGTAGFSARLDLGKQLFYDPILSGDDDVSCAHCHHPGFAWGDGRALSIGVGGAGLGTDRIRTLPPGEASLEAWEFMTPRNSPTILDAGHALPDPGGEPWEGRMFWDGREFSLEKQARAPLRSRDEMRHDAYGGLAAVTEVCNALRAIPEYFEAFKVAFPEDLQWYLDNGGQEGDVVNGGTYGRAVAAYERELYTVDSPFDRFARGEDSALTLSQKRGLVAFFEAGCDACHHGAMFSDFEFYALGVAQGGPGKPPVNEPGGGNDYGRFEISGDNGDRHGFRTPTLRNVSLTAPYFHTGGEGTGGDYQTLRQVVEFSNRGGNDLQLPADELDGPGVGLGLSDQEIDDIVAFLESLTGTRIGSSRIDVDVPTTVPSQLDPPAVLEPVLRN